MNVAGYEIIDRYLFDDGVGFALGHHPKAPDPYVTWRFNKSAGADGFYWGHYCGNEADARKDLLQRVHERMEDYKIPCYDAKGILVPPKDAGQAAPPAANRPARRKDVHNKKKGRGDAR